MKTVVILMAFLLSCIIALSVVAYAQVDTNYLGYSPSIKVDLIKQDPDPVEPGQQIEVSFKLDNNGTTAQNVIFEIIPEYPFSLLPDESSTKSIGVLGSSQYGRQSVIVKYKLKVAQDASDDSHELKIRYKIEDYNAWIRIENFRVKVQSHDAILSAEEFYTVPSVAVPGDKTRLMIGLRNYATSLLKNIKVSLRIDDSTMPFSPIGSTNEKVISYINPQSNLSLEFDLLVDSSATSKAYKIPLNVVYSDRLNKNYSRTNLVTVIVGDTPNLGLTLERTDVYTSGSSGSVVLRIVNQGNPDIKFLNVKVLQNENVKVIGADEVYIGKLDSDDFSTAEFKLVVKGQNTVKIPVQLTYKDTNNNNYNQNKEAELQLYSSNEAKSLGLKSSNNYLWILAVIVLIGGVYYYFKRRKNKK